MEMSSEFSPQKYVNSRVTVDSALTTALSRSEVFKGLSAPVLQAFARLGKTEVHPRRSVIFDRGEKPGFFYVVIKGVVSMCLMEADRDMVFGLIRENDVFGQTSRAQDPAQLRHVALTECVLAIFPVDAVETLLREEPTAARSFLTATECRVRQAYDRLLFFTLRDVTARLSLLLLELASSFGSQVGETIRIDLKLTNQEMASMVGTTRETINRTLNKLWDNHVIDMRTHFIIILDMDALHAACEVR